MYKQYKETKIEILEQGSPIVNNGIIYKKTREIALVEIDLSSKYCKVLAEVENDNTPGILIVADKNSLNLNTKVKKSKPTEIKLSDFKGWKVYLSNYSMRYTLYLTLIKKTKK